eukprot:CAMPEP_0195530174 /NCGR_PEP_ID=MMETSP0794_2-20130614/32976_1 /TAXON_ID=515487 /ORGANISM="Stephanopyxis turris, Strain CCMP 815" /LENGTH=193 /DNA_ID=CAMNT_0040661623 /DNA_START=143 /DNA_END=725 /DNA_ORIENTATION=-
MPIPLSHPKPADINNIANTDNSATDRRTALSLILTGAAAATPSLILAPTAAHADLASAASNGVPMLGRFEKLTGAMSFIGSWRYEANAGPKTGELVFLKNGEVELRSLDDSSVVVGVGAVPWKYVSPKGGDTIVNVSFTIDAGEDVLILQGAVDSAGGQERVLEGSIETGRAEVGARGGGPRKKIGSFSARLM